MAGAEVAGAEVVRGRALPLKSDACRSGLSRLGGGRARQLDASLGALPAHTRTETLTVYDS